MPLPTKPRPSPKHREERVKLLATGLQNLAVVLFGAVLLTPLVNASFTVTWAHRLAALAGFAVLEGLALYLLGFIPTSEET